MVMSVGAGDRRSSYDIDLDGQGLHLIEAIDVKPSPGAEPPPDAVYNDFSGGMGNSEGTEPDRYGWDEGLCSRVPGVVLPGGKITEMAVPTDSVDIQPFRSSVVFGGHLYFFGGRYAIACQNGYSPTLIRANDFGSNTGCIVNAPWIFGGNLYVATIVASTGAPYHLWRLTGAGAWTEHATILRVKQSGAFWEAGGVGANRLVSMPNYTQFQTVTGDPTVGANYTAAVDIAGAEQYGIGSIAASAKHVFFCGPEGVFDVDSHARVANLAPYLRDTFVTSNGQACLIDDDGALHVNVGNGADRIPLSGVQIHRPEHYQPNHNSSADGSPCAGYFTTVTRDQEWLVWTVYNPADNKTRVMYAQDTGQRWVFHGSEATFDGIVTHTRVHSPYAGHARLWVCTENTPGSYPRIYWVDLAFSGNPYQDWVHGGGHKFATHGSKFVGDRWVRPATKRIPLRYNIESENVSSVSKVSVWRRDDKEVDSSGNPVYTRKAVAQSKAYESTSDLSSVSVARCDLRIDIDGTEDEPGILRGVRVEADVNVEQRRRTRYIAVVRNPDVTARGTKQRTQVMTIVRHLRTLEGINATPVTLKNFVRGETEKVRMIPGLQEHWKKDRNGAWECVVSFELDSLSRKWQWGDGTKWGSQAQFGSGVA